MLDKTDIGIVVLAGGKSRRMDGLNKGLVRLNGMPLIEHVIKRLDPDIRTIVISANNDLEYYRATGYPVIEDLQPGQSGPLNGIYSAMHYLDKTWILCVPCDLPLLPDDYVERMLSHDRSAKAYVAFDGHRLQNGCCLLHHTLKEDLGTELKRQHLAIYRFLQKHHAQRVDFSDEENGFTNINTPQQLAMLKD